MAHETPEVTHNDETVEITEKTRKHYDDRNEATLTGTMIKKTKTENATYLSVLTTAGRNRDIVSLINVKAANDCPGIDELEEKSRVTVNGKLRCRPVHRNGKDEKPVYEPYVQATEVFPAKSAMEEAFGIKGRAFGDSGNRVIMTGIVTRMVQINRKSARITLSIREEGEKERLVESVFYARNNMKNLLPILAVGNKVCAIAEIQNYKKDPTKSYTVNGKTVVKEEELVQEPDKPVYVRNVVILDVNDV